MVENQYKIMSFVSSTCNMLKMLLSSMQCILLSTKHSGRIWIADKNKGHDTASDPPPFDMPDIQGIQLRVVYLFEYLGSSGNPSSKIEDVALEKNTVSL